MNNQTETLADFVRPDLRVLSIGINPSLHAVKAGFPFAFPRNRFWPALNASILIEQELTPSVAATIELLDRYGIGFTDVVKRATPGMKQLRAADYAAGAPILANKIRDTSPQWLWFHGKTAIKGFARYFDWSHDIDWGEQRELLCGIRCYVSPNPSPANASFSHGDFVASYNDLSALLDRGRGKKSRND